MNAALAAETHDKAQETHDKAQEKPQKRRKTITLIQRVEYQLQVEVDEQDLDEGMDAYDIIDKYLNGMPDWYGGGEQYFIDDNS